MIKKFLISLLCLSIFYANLGYAQEKEINLGKIKVKELEKIYQFYNYNGERGYLQIPGYYYPPIFLSSLPTDFSTIQDEKTRIILFFKILAPLALKLNQEILKERKEIQVIDEFLKKNQDLTAKQNQFIEEKAQKYDIFTRLKGHQRQTLLLKELLLKVDEVPASFLLANAAIATNYGSSRQAQEGNALFKELLWNQQEKGLKPIGEKDDDSYRLQTFSNLYNSMSNFALKLNSSVAFEHMRDQRKNLRYRGSLLTGTTFAYSLLWNTPLKNYAGTLEYTIAFYELNIIDKSLLNSRLINEPLPTKLGGKLTNVTKM